MGLTGSILRGFVGVMQGNPLSPRIFNMWLDVVVRHWLTVMLEGAEEWGVRGQEGRHHNALLFVDNGMVAIFVATMDPGSI